MPTRTEVPGVRISPHMNLEQAMAEVRAYLEAKKYSPVQGDFSTFAAGQLSMQSAFIGRLNDIAARLGQVEPNSKLGAPGVFLKRLLRKSIGWYSRPAQEFDRTSLETFQQIRQDMLQLQQQVLFLSNKIAAMQLPVEGMSESRSGSRPDELSRSMFSLFRSMIAAPPVRRALQEERPELLEKVESLLQEAEAQYRSDTRP